MDGDANYEVSSFGGVRNATTERILKHANDGGGYPHVVLNKDGKKRTRNTHQLVAEAFIENPEDKRCIDHIDSNKKNNCVENLRRATHSQNGMNQKIRTNTSSIYKGVYHHKPTKKWMSYIRINGKLKIWDCSNTRRKQHANITKRLSNTLESLRN